MNRKSDGLEHKCFLSQHRITLSLRSNSGNNCHRRDSGYIADDGLSCGNSYKYDILCQWTCVPTTTTTTTSTTTSTVTTTTTSTTSTTTTLATCTVGATVPPASTGSETAGTTVTAGTSVT